jgi:NADH:ubiquinone oxidoreductase subunit 2 (subunit N)
MMKGLAFLAAGAIVFNLKQAKGDHSPLMVKDLDGISQKYPWYALLLSIAVLALGGLPPLAGFISKWQIFAGGALSKNPWAMFLIVFAGINSVLSLGYYAPLVNRMYRHQPSQTVLAGISKCSATMLASLILLGIFVVLLGLFPMLISNYTGSASSALLNMFR